MLKVDVELAEWPFFRNVITEDRDQLNTVRQLLLEIHSPRYKPHRVTKEDSIEMVFYAKALKDLGFTVYLNRQYHKGCRYLAAYMPRGVPERCCQETYYVNSAYAKATNSMAVSGQI